MQALLTNEDAQALALMALAWTLKSQDRAERLLALTGLSAVDLRARAAEPGMQAALIAFLEAHEPDLMACAEAIGTKPETLVAARALLER